MATDKNAPVDLYVAAYLDPDAARADWDVIKRLAADDTIKVEGLVLVSRRSDGKIHVDDNFHTARKGAAWGAVGGAIIGLIFPPTLFGRVPWSAPGPGRWRIGLGWWRHGEKAAIKADVEDTLPLNSSGIVAVFEEQWATDVDKALTKASKVTKNQVDGDNVEAVKTAVAKNPPAPTS